MATPRTALVTKAQELMKNEWLDYASAARKARDISTQTPATPVTPIIPWLSPKNAQWFVAGTPTYNQWNNENWWGMENPKNNTISFGEATYWMNAEQR